ncbi:anti-sigma factor antagonist [Rhodophyticola sp. CCM32]|uniref:STAS domain-containing protein n=1 Tax=Rhodophyticola sp. CCM32 TaxID=2916397 RepID=UPI00107F9398|nr:STAS domain-containing protein [Rhodophyticola sp. CCM32]QBY01235.1 anti-sigma factor antagonist [Rhodophyticola sp. CCM32]
MIKIDTTDTDISVITPDTERLTAVNATQFKEQVVALVDSGKARLIIDMSGVSFVDSAGLGALVGVLKRIGNRGDIVVCSLADGVRQMFELTRMNRIFAEYPDRMAAVAALKEAL